MDNRKAELGEWVNQEVALMLGKPNIAVTLQHLSGDASFRTYYRAVLPACSYIVVDSPPETEDINTFVRIADAFRAAGVATPIVYRLDFQRGFMLQEDFGDQLYLEALQASYDAPDKIDQLYKQAIDALISLQKNVDRTNFPTFDLYMLQEEMTLFQDWFCDKFLQLSLSDDEEKLIADSFDFLAEQALAQPQVAVHRDYHSRNLMIPLNAQKKAGQIPGVIDFQDAVAGPYTYDLVSLLRDCYISWPEPYVQVMGLYYLDRAEESGVIKDIDAVKFFRDFDLMGLQRNLKVMGIFARLCIRDNKPQFLAYIPQVIRYFITVAADYPELTEFLNWYKLRILPKAIDKLPAGELCAQ